MEGLPPLAGRTFLFAICVIPIKLTCRVARRTFLIVDANRRLRSLTVLSQVGALLLIAGRSSARPSTAPIAPAFVWSISSYGAVVG
jgi:hypothetical protein